MKERKKNCQLIIDDYHDVIQQSHCSSLCQLINFIENRNKESWKNIYNNKCIFAILFFYNILQH